jgi:hypothetical protein
MDHDEISGDSKRGREKEAEEEGDPHFQKSGERQKKEKRRQNEPEDVHRKGPDGLGVLCLDIDPEDGKKGCEGKRGQQSSHEAAAFGDLRDQDDDESREDDFDQVKKHREGPPFFKESLQ